MMQKVKFLEAAELKQGDGKGPKFTAGKAYWLSPDQATRWKSEGIAEDAPASMKAENEPEHYLPRPDQVKLVGVKNGRWDVIGPNDHRFNSRPLTADEAEKLRLAVLNGEIRMPLATETPVAAPVAQPIRIPTAPAPSPAQTAAVAQPQGTPAPK